MQEQLQQAIAEKVQLTSHLRSLDPEAPQRLQEQVEAKEQAQRELDELRAQLASQEVATREAQGEAEHARSTRSRVQWELKRIGDLLRQEQGIPLKVATRIADSVGRAQSALKYGAKGGPTKGPAVVDLISDDDDAAAASQAQQQGPRGESLGVKHGEQ